MRTTNVGRATTRGIEFGLSAQLSERLMVTGGYTYLRARDQDAQRDLPGRPRHALRVRAKWTTPWEGRLEIKLRRDSTVWADTEGTLRSPAGEEWDLNAEQPLWGSVVLRLGIENLLDSRRDLDQPRRPALTERPSRARRPESAVVRKTAKYTTLNQSARLVMSPWERGPLARWRAGRPRSQVKPYCRVLRENSQTSPFTIPRRDPSCNASVLPSFSPCCRH